MARPDKETWALAASGEFGGDGIKWQKEYEVIGDAIYLLTLLENIDGNEIAWPQLIDQLLRFKVLQDLDFPLLQNESDIKELDGFLTLTAGPREGNLGMSFNSTKVYIERDKAQAIVRDCTNLGDRLRAYAPLKPFLEDWI